MMEGEVEAKEVYNGFFATNLGMIIVGVVAYIVISGINQLNQLVFGYTFSILDVVATLGLAISALGIISAAIETLRKFRKKK